MKISEVTSNHLVATPETIDKAKQFLLMKWKERAKERGSSEPNDLSNACKFASLFAQKLFGGKIQGNWHHQYNILPNGQILDLTEPSKDLIAIQSAGHDPYTHDKSFWNNPEHRESISSCKPRVNRWVKEFLSSNSSELNESDWLDSIHNNNRLSAIFAYPKNKIIRSG